MENPTSIPDFETAIPEIKDKKTEIGFTLEMLGRKPCYGQKRKGNCPKKTTIRYALQREKMTEIKR